MSLFSIEKSRNTAETPRATPRNAQSAAINLLKAGIRAAVVAAKLAGPAALAASCNGNDAGVPRVPPAIGQSIAGLTINDLNPPRAPLVLPLQNGVAARVNQIAGGTTSHNGNSTRHAVDFADETLENFNGLALTPVSGTVTRRQGNCQENTHAVPGNGCNGGWGNAVEVQGRDGQIYLFAHCDSYSPETPDGTFVLRGTPICRIGSTGNSDGIHLHFDKVERSQSGAYSSVGIDKYLTMLVGQAEPSLIIPDAPSNAPDQFATCCYSCGTTPQAPRDQPPTNPTCFQYLSFNRPLTDTLAGFVPEIQRAYPQIIQLDGELTPDADLSQQYSPWIIVRQNVTLYINFQRVPSHILFIVSSPSGAGQRNPFIDTAFSYLASPAEEGRYLPMLTHTQIHTPRFVNFDLWDLVNSAVGGGVPFTQRVEEYPNWSREWELFGSRFQINEEIIDAYLAVWRQNRAYRAGIFYRNGAWSDWYWM